MRGLVYFENQDGNKIKIASSYSLKLNFHFQHNRFRAKIHGITATNTPAMNVEMTLTWLKIVGRHVGAVHRLQHR